MEKGADYLAKWTSGHAVGWNIMEMGQLPFEMLKNLMNFLLRIELLVELSLL